MIAVAEREMTTERGKYTRTQGMRLTYHFYAMWLQSGGEVRWNARIAQGDVQKGFIAGTFKSVDAANLRAIVLNQICRRIETLDTFKE